MNRNRQDGKLFVAKFKIEGQEFIALNGGPGHNFNEAGYTST